MTSVNEVYYDAIEKYGIEAQVDVAIEEMSELTKALLKYRRVENKNIHTQEEPYFNLLEEIADVQIMLEQLRIIYDPGSVETIMKRKQNRLAKKLEMPLPWQEVV
jgi:NTP pyrophosphatase (non-canonical NTP hydrolase)